MISLTHGYYSYSESTGSLPTLQNDDSLIQPARQAMARWRSSFSLERAVGSPVRRAAPSRDQRRARKREQDAHEKPKGEQCSLCAHARMALRPGRPGATDRTKRVRQQSRDSPAVIVDFVGSDSSTADYRVNAVRLETPARPPGPSSRLTARDRRTQESYSVIACHAAARSAKEGQPQSFPGSENSLFCLVVPAGPPAEPPGRTGLCVLCDLLFNISLLLPFLRSSLAGRSNGRQGRRLLFNISSFPSFPSVRLPSPPTSHPHRWSAGSPSSSQSTIASRIKLLFLS
jgi:hypothetical protein